MTRVWFPAPTRDSQPFRISSLGDLIPFSDHGGQQASTWYPHAYMQVKHSYFLILRAWRQQSEVSNRQTVTVILVTFGGYRGRERTNMLLPAPCYSPLGVKQCVFSLVRWTLRPVATLVQALQLRTCKNPASRTCVDSFNPTEHKPGARGRASRCSLDEWRGEEGRSILNSRTPR